MIQITADSALIKHTCPMCGQIHEMEVSKESAMKYFQKRIFIQDAFPELNPTEREFIKTGYCPECQQLLFGKAATDKIKEAC